MVEEQKDNNSNGRGEVATNNNILPPELLKQIWPKRPEHSDVDLQDLEQCGRGSSVLVSVQDYETLPAYLEGIAGVPANRYWGVLVQGQGWKDNICWRRTSQEILQHPVLKKITLHQGWLIC